MIEAPWNDCKLGDVLTLQRGFDLPKKKRRVGDVPIVSSSGVSGYHDEAKVAGPGVVTGRYGTLGEVFYVEGDFWPLNTTLYVREYKGNDPLFLSYFLQTLDLAHQNAAGAVPGLNRNALHLLPVRVPPLSTQRKIASVLSAYDDLIENNTRRIEVLEEMAQAIYREWFVNFRFPGHDKVEMVPSELGPIPEGWHFRQFSDVADLFRSSLNPSRYGDEVFAHFSIPAFDEGGMPKMEAGASIKSNKYSVPQGCVLLSKINPRIARVWLPFPVAGIRAIGSTEFLVLIPQSPLTDVFLFGLCRSDEFLEAFAGRALGTSTSHQRVKPEDLLGMPLVVPPHDVVKAYSRVAEPILRLAHTLRFQNVGLRRTRDLLLPKLVSGEVGVEDVSARVAL